MQQDELQTNEIGLLLRATQLNAHLQLYPLMDAVESLDIEDIRAALPFLTGYNVPIYIRPPSNLRISQGRDDSDPQPSTPLSNGAAIPLPTHLIDELTTGLDSISTSQITHGTESLNFSPPITIHVQNLLIDRDDHSSEVVAKLRAIRHSNRQQPQLTTKQKSTSLLQAIRSYCKQKEREQAWTTKSALDNSVHLQTFREIVGNKSVHAISGEDWEKFYDTLLRLPSNRAKKYPNRSVTELLAMNCDKTLSKRSIQKYCATIAGFDNWLAQRFPGSYHSSRKSVIQATPKKTDSPSKGRPPFTPAQLSTIFQSRIAIELLENCDEDYKIFLPLLAAHTGARLEELTQLSLSDVQREGDIPYIDINRAGDTRKKLKNSFSIRRIPLSRVVINLGFERYVNYLRALPTETTDGRLFYELKYSNSHGFHRNASRWWNEQHLPRLQIKNALVNWHTFRHTASNQLNRGHILKPHIHLAQWQIDRFLGHKPNKNESTSVTHYLNDTPVADLVPCCEHLDYGIDWSGYAELIRRRHPHLFTT